MGDKYSVLTEPLLRNPNVKCLTSKRNIRQPYNDNFSLFTAIAVLLYSDAKLEADKSKFFELFLRNSEEASISKIQDVHMNDHSNLENLLNFIVFIYKIAFVDGQHSGELVQGSIDNFDETVAHLQYNNHICYVNNINSLFQVSRSSTYDTFSFQS